VRIAINSLPCEVLRWYRHSVVPVFELQFPAEQVPDLAARFPVVDESACEAAGAAARGRGYYRRAEFVLVCAWKTVRSTPKVALNTAPAVRAATRRALADPDEAARMQALLSLAGVGVPTASTLLYFAFPALYPILDVRALESLGVRPRSTYPIAFWLEYLAACRVLASDCDVSLRTLDKALWQWSKERSDAGGGSRTPTGLRPPAPKAGVSTVSPRPRGVAGL
jgi:hypothetical protein